MGFVQYCLAVLLPAQLLLAFPSIERTYKEGNRICEKCPAGKFAKSCNVCEPCRAGSYTTELNSEPQCDLCFRDCSPKNHLRVVQNCTSTTPLKCECEPGFRCATRVSFSDNCKECERLQDTTEGLLGQDGRRRLDHYTSAERSGKDKQTSSPPSSGQTELCLSPKCHMVPTPNHSSRTNKEHTSAQLAAILCPLVFIGCVSLITLLCIYHPRDQTCFRQTIAKLCSDEGQDASHTSKEATLQFPKDSFSAKQQTPSLSAAHLGPVHVHNPGTVIFSLLSQFTGQVGPTILGGKRAERASNQEKDERDCPVFHPEPSPFVPLSEEERCAEGDNIFVPSQEQGKDYHMSKEEGL